METCLLKMHILKKTTGLCYDSQTSFGIKIFLPPKLSHFGGFVTIDFPLMRTFKKEVALVPLGVVFVANTKKQPLSFFPMHLSYHIWHWFLALIKVFMPSNGMEALSIYDRSWSKQWEVIIQASIISILNTI